MDRLPLQHWVRDALDGRYHIRHEIGHGAMATVFLGEARKTGNGVAVKVLHAELAAAVGPERFHMSPEQAMGHENLGPACDVYALGCVVYEMLTGELPFTGPTPQALVARQLTEPPRPMRTVRPDLAAPIEAAVLAALAKESSRRPRSGEDFLSRMTRGSR